MTTLCWAAVGRQMHGWQEESTEGRGGCFVGFLKVTNACAFDPCPRKS